MIAALLWSISSKSSSGRLPRNPGREAQPAARTTYGWRPVRSCSRWRTSGVPVGVLEGGKPGGTVYVLITPAPSLADHMAKTVKVTGKTAYEHGIIPDKIASIKLHFYVHASQRGQMCQGCGCRTQEAILIGFTYTVRKMQGTMGSNPVGDATSFKSRNHRRLCLYCWPVD